MSGNVAVIRYNRMGIAFQFDTKTNKVTGIFVAAGIPNTGPGFVGLGGQQGGQQGPGMFGGQPGGASPPPSAPGMPGAPGGGGGGKWGGGAAGPAI
jgi:hypothetical protein